jgi:hypothetical protein
MKYSSPIFILLGHPATMAGQNNQGNIQGIHQAEKNQCMKQNSQGNNHVNRKCNVEKE